MSVFWGKLTSPQTSENVRPTFHSEALSRAARSRGVELSIFSVEEPKEIKSAIEAAKASGCEAINFLVLLRTPCFTNQAAEDVHA